MISFIARRLAQFLVTLLAASFLLFAVTEFSPGNVASKILGPYAVQSQVDLLYDKLDLGAPLLERYGRWLGTLLGLSDNTLGDPAIGLGLDDPRGPRYFGNLGYSLMLKEPVVDVLAQRIGHTVALAVWAIGFIVPIALILGVMSGINAGRPLDRGISGLTVTLTSLPEFVTAVALLLLFSATLGWLPGTSALIQGDQWSRASQMVLPVSVLVIASASYVTRIVRASVADTLRRPFVRTARLKGLSPQRIVLQHVLRNALIAPLTVILLQVNWILTGVVVVEAIFAYPGIGSLLLKAALFGDIYVVQALTLLALTVAVGTQFVGDVAYMLLDPKIRLR
jgi:peptide/nickel transport system permease protein